MSSVRYEQIIGDFQDMVSAPERVGVSEFARSKDWRKRLPESGCFEVIDRSGTVGYMLAPDYAAALSERLSALEAELEQMQVSAIFAARSGYDDLRSGEDLKSAALDYFDEHGDALSEAAGAD